MQLEQWEAAASAYYQATNLEPSSADAWNNLSAAYLHVRTMEAKVTYGRKRSYTEKTTDEEQQLRYGNS